MLTSPSLLTRLLAVVALVAAAGCGTLDNDSGAADSVVRIVVQEEPPMLDAGDVGPAQGRVNRNIVEALVDIDAESGELLPLLAESWEQVDERTWEFTLRQDVTFHNGEPFTADAVVHALSRLYGPGEPFIAASVIPELTAEAVDEHTVRVSDDEPNPILPRQMFFVPVMEPGATGDSRNVREPVGTGPYTFTSWSDGHIILDAYEDYWGGEPSVERLDFQWRADSSVRAQMVQQGEADIATDLAPQDISGLRTVSGTGETAAFRPDTTCPLFSDLRVREALYQAVDRQLIAETIFGGEAEPAAQLIDSGVIGHSEALEPVAHDADAARALVDEVRAEQDWPDRPVVVTYRPGWFLGAEELAQVMGQALEDLGFTVELNGMEARPFLDAFLIPLDDVPEDRCALFLTSAGNEFRDASYSIDLYYADGGALTLNADPEFDARYAEVAELSDDDARDEVMAGLLEHEFENMKNVVPVVHMQRTYAVAEGIEWEARPDSYVMGVEMSLSSP